MRQLLDEKNREIHLLKETQNKMKDAITKIYSSPNLLANKIDDKSISEILSQNYVAQAKLHLAFIFASPLIMKYKDGGGNNELKHQTMMALDYEKELRGLISGIKETGNQIKYR